MLDGRHFGASPWSRLNRIELGQVAPSVMLPISHPSAVTPPNPCQPGDKPFVQLPPLYRQHLVEQDDTLTYSRSFLQHQLHIQSQSLEEQRRMIERQQARIAYIEDIMEALFQGQKNLYAIIEAFRRLPEACVSVQKERPDTDSSNPLARIIKSVATNTSEAAGIEAWSDGIGNQSKILESRAFPGAIGVPFQASQGFEQVHTVPYLVAESAAATSEQTSPRNQLLGENRPQALIVAKSDTPESFVSIESPQLPRVREHDQRITPYPWLPASVGDPARPEGKEGSHPQAITYARGHGWEVNNTYISKRSLSQSSSDPMTDQLLKRQQGSPSPIGLRKKRSRKQRSLTQSSSSDYTVRVNPPLFVSPVRSSQNSTDEPTGSKLQQPKILQFVHYVPGP
jgi:hypothetical protein